MRSVLIDIDKLIDKCVERRLLIPWNYFVRRL